MTTRKLPELPLKGHKLVQYHKSIERYSSPYFKCSCGEADFGKWTDRGRPVSNELAFVLHCVDLLGAESIKP
jgi:hypothetical protein